MTELAWINGEICDLQDAKVAYLDRGYLFGDGVYEVIRIYDYQPFGLERHLVRFAQSLEAIKITVPYTEQELTGIISQLLQRAQIKEAQVYLQVTRGIAPRQHAFPLNTKASLTMFVTGVEVDETLWQKGVKAVTVADERWANCFIKSTSLLANILAKEAAREQGAYEAIFVQDGTWVREGSSSNIFAVLDGKLLTPPADRHILAGITRGYCLELAQGLGIPTEVCELTIAELRMAQEMFLTSSISEVMPIAELDGRIIGSGRLGPVTAQLQKEYRQLQQRAGER